MRQLTRLAYSGSRSPGRAVFTSPSRIAPLLLCFPCPRGCCFTDPLYARLTSGLKPPCRLTVQARVRNRSTALPRSTTLPAAGMMSVSLCSRRRRAKTVAEGVGGRRPARLGVGRRCTRRRSSECWIRTRRTRKPCAGPRAHRTREWNHVVAHGVARASRSGLLRILEWCGGLA